MVRKSFAGGAVETTLNGSITNVATTATLTDGSTYPTTTGGPFVIVVDPGTSVEEKILVATRAGNALSGMTRGYDGTTAVAHASAIVRHVFDADTADEANAHVNDDARDDHGQYMAASGTRHDLAARHPTSVLTAVPWGTLGYAQAVVDQLGITTITDLTNLSAAVTVGAGRRIRISAGGIVSADTVGNIEHQLSIREGATFKQVSILLSSAANYMSHHFSVVLTPSTGAHTYKVSLAKTGGAGTVGLRADALNPAYILVEDIGLA